MITKSVVNMHACSKMGLATVALKLTGQGMRLLSFKGWVFGQISVATPKSCWVKTLILGLESAGFGSRDSIKVDGSRDEVKVF